MGEAERDFEARFLFPLCVLGIRTEGDVISEIQFLPRSAGSLEPVDATAKLACEQLRQYLDDPKFRFSLPLKLGGTAHQRAVWSQMQKIPCGRTLSYGDIAARLGSGPRAVGQACGANPVAVVVPCHRVIAKSGLGGFAQRDNGFPLTVKAWLLDHENAQW